MTFIIENLNNMLDDGYERNEAEATLAQDILVKAIAKSNISNNITIKGGVAIRNISKNKRRATRDLDLDFIKYSISDDSLRKFILCINCLENINIELVKNIEELNQQDYKGKRVYVKISDNEYSLTTKMDIGIHKDLDIKQEEYYFDLCFDDGVNLLMNSKEQIVTEKLKSLLRFGVTSTRYKDIYDLYYLLKEIDKNKLIKCFDKYIFSDKTISIKSMSDISLALNNIFNNKNYIEKLYNSNKNWIGINNEVVLNTIIDFFYIL